MAYRVKCVSHPYAYNSLLRIEDKEEAAVFCEVVTFTPDPLPVRYYDKDTGRPVSFYLSSLEELLAWTPTTVDSFNVASKPLEGRQPPLSSQRPRTLLCHDMMGGYLDDRFIQGSPATNPYCFYHWQYIDIFVYFSHHMVTIPPVCWTNAAHRHGVSVLGTFITEWKEGGQHCEAFLAGDERSFRAVADQLVRIAQFFRFDGWLINIENSLSLAAVGNLPCFLRYLRAQLQQQVPGGLVLWYDSVVSSGQLKWQDELNEHNRRAARPLGCRGSPRARGIAGAGAPGGVGGAGPRGGWARAMASLASSPARRVFFESCDGFFTNYNWREEHLARMLEQAGPRRADVYVGVDVFARGNVVGGRFDTDKSLELIRKHGFSAALFAPGWVYECLEKKDFFQNQDRFWSLLAPYLPTHSICSLPFVTSFCLGMGTRRVCHGQEEAVGPWFHLSAQEIQPLFGEHRPEGGSQGWVKTHCCLTDAWHGGSSLLVQGRLPPAVEYVAVRLFSLHVPAPPKIFLSVVYKLEEPSGVRVALELTTGEAGSCHVGSASEVNAQTSPRLRPRPLRVPPTKLARWVGRCGQPLRGGWVQRCYEVSLRGCLLRDLFVSFSRRSGRQDQEDFVCRLGEVQVVGVGSLLTPLAQVQAVTVSQVGWRRAAPEGEAPPGALRLSCTLHWAYPLPLARSFRIHCCGGARGPEEPTLLGLAFVNQYRVVELAVAAPTPGRDGRVEFLVEPVPREGLPVPRAEWGRAALLYSTPA
ncbi:Cytosolic endo-beta-N-acetylglucosaminidase [Galemys pyrenaicus]|uniref:mannosyl-glycoprotein endo-beta-N-acetylglucosaminidase n=1 Tax=Galemys pyrenaicus TaxID=202257 RepID=A0A8J6DGE0_GALPY|nr:Cytosolic endo-beta-N-acetylglucosaminidase [Galemys pyrenaicus]